MQVRHGFLGSHRIGLSVWPHLAQLALFGHSFVGTFGRFDPVLKFTIRLRKEAHNFIEFRGGKSSGPAVQQLDLLTNPISMPRHANAPAEIVSNAVLHILGPGGTPQYGALWTEDFHLLSENSAPERRVHSRASKL